MTIQNYSRVKLLTHFNAQEGVCAGSIGYVIEVYPDDKYEIEFSDKNGITVAQIVVNLDEIAVASESDGK